MQATLDEYAAIRSVLTPEELAELDYLLAWEPPVDFSKYAADPVGFAEQVLGYTLSDGMKAVMLSVLNNRTTVVRSSNSVGKTVSLAILAVWFYVCHPDAKVHTLAAPPKSNLETKLWGEINKILLKHPELFEGCNRGKMWVSRQQERRDATDFIEGIAVPQDADPYMQQASVAGSHAPHQLYIVDEGDGVGEPVYAGIDTCMTGPHERLVICYNPRQELGRPWQLEIQEMANVIELSAFTHPHVMTGETIWPGAVTREITVKRINEQCKRIDHHETPDAECFELPIFLEGATAHSDSGREYPPLRKGWYKVQEYEFWHVVLGKFSPRGSDRHYFRSGGSREWLQGRLNHWLSRGKHGELLYPPFEVISPGQMTGSNIMSSYWEIYEAPQDGDEYVLGADGAGGIKTLLDKSADRDFNEAAIYNRRTMAQVAAGWGRENCDPEQFADDLAELGRHFNEALIIPEINNHGRTIFQRLKDWHGYKNLYYRTSVALDPVGKPVEDKEMGFETDEVSKKIRDNYLRSLIRESALGYGKFDVRSERQIKQLMQYGEVPGKTAQALVGHDDGVTVIALCALVLVEDPWIDPSIYGEEEPEEPLYQAHWGRVGR